MTSTDDSSQVDSALVSEWDQRYEGLAERLTGIETHDLLTREVASLVAGRAVDIGCGAGAEAVWLAAQGWQVTGLDVSSVALSHADRRASEAGVEVLWLHGTLLNAPLRSDGYDLVTAFYPALLHSGTDGALKALTSYVARGGTLIVVHHANIDVERAKSFGFDPADYVSHHDVVALLSDDDGWEIRIERDRAKRNLVGPMSEYSHDDVVIAHRRS